MIKTEKKTSKKPIKIPPKTNSYPSSEQKKQDSVEKIAHNEMVKAQSEIAIGKPQHIQKTTTHRIINGGVRFKFFKAIEDLETLKKLEKTNLTKLKIAKTTNEKN